MFDTVGVATAANRRLAASSVTAIFPILTLPAIRDLRDRRSLMTGARHSPCTWRGSVLAVQDFAEISINHLYALYATIAEVTRRFIVAKGSNTFQPIVISLS